MFCITHMCSWLATPDTFTSHRRTMAVILLVALVDSRAKSSFSLVKVRNSCGQNNVIRHPCGNGNIPPIEMVITAGWLMIVWATLPQMLIMPRDVHLHGLQRCQALCTIGGQPWGEKVVPQRFQVLPQISGSMSGDKGLQLPDNLFIFK